MLAKPYVERPEGDGSDDAELAADSWRKDQLRNDSIVNALLGGQMRSQVQCDTCERVVVRYCRQVRFCVVAASAGLRFDYFHTVQLAIPKSVDEATGRRRLSVYFIEEAAEFQELGRRPQELELELGHDEDLRSLGSRVARAAGVDAGDDDIQFAILVPGKGKLSSYSVLSLVEPSAAVSSSMAALLSRSALLGAYLRSQRGSRACILTQVSWPSTHRAGRSRLTRLSGSSQRAARRWRSAGPWSSTRRRGGAASGSGFTSGCRFGAVCRPTSGEGCAWPRTATASTSWSSCGT